MSYDVFFQGFVAGESSGHRWGRMRNVVAPHVSAQAGAWLQVRFGDGDADLYLSEDGMMANHISGRAPWQLLVTGARAANWVILPLDRPACLTVPGQREELPEERADGAVFVESGADLLKLIMID
ncbi:MAG: hypothetical protein L0H22_04140 [Brevibacterium aurantiacum]|nr:hypothetical protein [Brevibacterium aurantiacum]